MSKEYQDIKLVLCPFKSKWFDHKPITKTKFISSKLNEKYPSLQTALQFECNSSFQNYIKHKAFEHKSRRITHSYQIY